MVNRESILREARVLRVAAGHPYLCHMHAAFQTQNYAFIAMEFASRGSLKDLLTKKHHLKTRQVIFYSAEMVCGLQYLHSRGIIHSDLKPDNILVSSEGHIKIADFGLAAENIFGNDTICVHRGTMKYMAPEVLEDQQYNAAVDWWAFGIILCQMATGRYPFNDKNGAAKLRHSILEDRPKVPVWTPSKVVTLLKKLLRKKASSRYGINGNIRQCVFFYSIDWDALENGRLSPPFQLEALQQPARNNEGNNLFLHESAPRGVNIIEGFSYQSPSWQE
ncbi:protein kinase C delta type-like [Xenopus tropicalis]|uniref:Protein kinase C delta type-like n=1 Tax=Xenopus tropicalis TaxID=8364 RepID=A0A803K370_XENTR|nr:protein kinase C delta type-like [Xenopus tropicalis]|eukprot:XP_017949838.1 PREDICTED: protein kinase C delta type-like [Xenopus tropicalis]